MPSLETQKLSEPSHAMMDTLLKDLSVSKTMDGVKRESLVPMFARNARMDTTSTPPMSVYKEASTIA